MRVYLEERNTAKVAFQKKKKKKKKKETIAWVPVDCYNKAWIKIIALSSVAHVQPP